MLEVIKELTFTAALGMVCWAAIALFMAGLAALLTWVNTLRQRQKGIAKIHARQDMFRDELEKLSALGDLISQEDIEDLNAMVAQLSKDEGTTEH